jgi:hypothetical protein
MTMSIIKKFSFAVAVGVVSGGILSSVANRALASRDATEAQLADAVRTLAEQSEALARSLEGVYPPRNRRQNPEIGRPQQP